MAASMRNPVVVILGATGTGKTKLSLELCKLFNGEIISADAMQIYKGLDIITNKATAEEMQMCRHHMIDFLSPIKENNTVLEYRNMALPIIDSLLALRKTPIIVGGSNYYISALLWNHLIELKDIQMTKASQKSKKRSTEATDNNSSHKSTDTTQADATFKPADGSSKGDTGSDGAGYTQTVDHNAERTSPLENTSRHGASTNDTSIDAELEEHFLTNDRGCRDQYEKLTNQELHDRLKLVDPELAAKRHPNDRRKIIRGLEVYDWYGVPSTEVYRQQKQDGAQGSDIGPLRYTNNCIFWIQCDHTVLDERLDARVDKMIEQGLVEELSDFHLMYNADRLKHGQEADYTTGIFQSIGFKEFHEYLLLNDTERQTEDGQKKFQQGVTDLKTATRRYSKYQRRWLERRFLSSQHENIPLVYGLDGTDVSQWEENVLKPAVTILTAFRKGGTSPIPPLQPMCDRVEFEYNECTACGVVTTVKQEWEKHLKSKKHKNWVKKHRNQMEQLIVNLDQHIKNKKRKNKEMSEADDMLEGCSELLQDASHTP